MSDEALEKFTAGQSTRIKSREVCVCGHSMNYHTDVPGRGSVCAPARISSCRCAEGRPILEADNLRLFMYITTGTAEDHALGKGVNASRKRGAGFRFLENPLKCDGCLEVAQGVYPVAIDPDSQRLSNTSTRINKILCKTCFDAWNGA
jgi:hypothetical protein